MGVVSTAAAEDKARDVLVHRALADLLRPFGRLVSRIFAPLRSAWARLSADPWVRVVAAVGLLMWGSVVLAKTLPRYEWRSVSGAYIRIDHWTGEATIGKFSAEDGSWQPYRQP